MTWPVLHDELSVARVDGQLVIVDRRTGQLSVADPIAALVIESRDLFRDLGDAATALHDALGGTEQTIRRQLLTVAETVESRRPAPSSPVGVPQRTSAERPAGEPAFVTHVDCLGVGMEVRCYTPQLAEVVPGLLEAHARSTARDHVFELWDVGTSLRLAVDGRLVADHTEVGRITSELLAQMMVIVHDEPSPNLRIHAGCVARDGHGVALGGAPRQGKSSTVLELARLGCAYLTDELVELDAASGVLRGLPRPIGLDGEIRLQYPELKPSWWDDDWWDPRWPVPPALVGMVAHHAKLSGLVVLEYGHGAATQITELQPVDALARLCPLVYNPAALTSSVLVALGEQLDAVPAAVVRHGGGRAAAVALLESGMLGWT